ncbi:hypothetical protein FIBSPDRAFT_864093, partial [Athelia psychrophila]
MSLQRRRFADGSPRQYAAVLVACCSSKGMTIDHVQFLRTVPWHRKRGSHDSEPIPPPPTRIRLSGVGEKTHSTSLTRYADGVVLIARQTCGKQSGCVVVIPWIPRFPNFDSPYVPASRKFFIHSQCPDNVPHIFQCHRVNV